MTDNLSPFTIIVAPDPLADIPPNPPITSDQIDSSEFLSLSAPTLCTTTLDSPDDYFVTLFSPSKGSVPEDHNDILAHTLQAVLEACREDLQNDSITYRIGPPVISTSRSTVQWLELYDPQTESLLLPSRNLMDSILLWSPDVVINDSQVERFYEGRPRIAFEIRPTGELLIHELIPQECYPEALENFFKAIRSSDQSFLYRSWEDSFRQFLAQKTISSEKSVELSIKESFDIAVTAHSSTQDSQFGCVISLIPKQALSGSKLYCVFQCDINIALHSEAYPEAVFSWYRCR
jgi:hypothetical protein